MVVTIEPLRPLRRKNGGNRQKEGLASKLLPTTNGRRTKIFLQATDKHEMIESAAFVEQPWMECKA